jgi:CheY-like chemotaxis protein/anti-sigma regulatory factor (Ser/Thr protein kinase)
VRDVLRTITAKKRIKVEVEVAADLSAVVGDASKLKQILYNYLSNALKFSPDEGRVWIRCLPEGAENFRIEVEDTGIGIRPEDMDRLFVEFQQLDASTAKRYQGTGLGLALTKRLTEAQGGRVEVRSVVGKGSVFSVVLPRILRSTSELDSDNVADLEAAVGAPTVLVVDDDADDRRWLAQTLGGAGYGVVAVATGAEAVHAAQQRGFAAMTLDLLLPDMSGWEVLEAVRATDHNAHVRTLVITVVKDAGSGHGLGVDDLLLKPVAPENLMKSLRRAGVPPEGSAILVVDDDARTLHLATIALAEKGYRALCEHDPAKVLSLIENERPTAIVVDLIMPQMTGFELIDRLRAHPHGKDLPIIVWTAKDLSDADRDRLRRDAEAVVAKTPGGTAALIREIRRVVGAGAAGSDGASDPPPAGSP